MEGPIRDRDGTAVIIVRRLTDQPFAVNPDLIERVECNDDATAQAGKHLRQLLTPGR